MHQECTIRLPVEGGIPELAPPPRPAANQPRSCFLARFLACTTLPHRRPDNCTYRRRDGATATLMHAPASVGLPYGVYPRLWLIHLSTSAILAGRRTVAAKSLGGMLHAMDLPDHGRAARRAREQLNRLCHTTFTITDRAGWAGSNIVIADQWFATPGAVAGTVGRRFFELAKAHPVPLDRAVLRQLKRSPMALDLYAWLAKHALELDAPAHVSWRSLMARFGAAYEHERQFRWMARQQLEAVTAAAPLLAAEACDHGLLVRPSGAARPTGENSR